MHHNIKDGAIFISDAHENEQRDGFWKFLCQVENGEIEPTQLFLMGDMFDLLVGEVSCTHEFAKKYIKKLENLAKKFPIYYFEGNHDYNLSKFFLHVNVFSISQQPVTFGSKIGDILLLHGDKYENIKYKIYTYIIRNYLICKGLNALNNLLSCRISNTIRTSQHSKNICKQITNFKEKISSKLSKYPIDNIKGIFEGHYHQNKEFSYNNLIYRNFSSFACDKSYFVVQFASGIKFTQLKLRGSNGSNI